MASNCSTDHRDVYSYKFEFERRTNYVVDTKWMSETWPDSIYYSVIYVVGIFMLKNFMSHRKAFNLRRPLFVWSTCLAIFSIFGTIRVVPEMWNVLMSEGIESSICSPYWRMNAVTACWSRLFALSKVLELGDTVFIVLRKQP